MKIAWKPQSSSSPTSSPPVHSHSMPQPQCHRLLKHQVELIILPLRLLQSALHAFYLSHGLDRSDRTSGATTKEGSHGATPRYQPIYYIFGSMKPSSFWGTKKILETPKSTPSRQHEIRTSPLCLDVTGNPRRRVFWGWKLLKVRLGSLSNVMEHLWKFKNLSDCSARFVLKNGCCWCKHVHVAMRTYLYKSIHQ